MTQEERDHEHKVTRQITFILGLMLLILSCTAIASVAASWISVGRALTTTVIIQHNQSDIINTYCPGDVMSVDYHVKTSKVPSIISIYDNWRSDDLGYNVVLEDNPQHSIISSPEDFTRTISVTIPSLQAGSYTYVRAAQEDGAPISVMSIPIKVVACP